jgi:hypothetical protein
MSHFHPEAVISLSLIVAMALILSLTAALLVGELSTSLETWGQ